MDPNKSLDQFRKNYDSTYQKQSQQRQKNSIIDKRMNRNTYFDAKSILKKTLDAVYDEHFNPNHNAQVQQRLLKDESQKYNKLSDKAFHITGKYSTKIPPLQFRSQKVQPVKANHNTFKNEIELSQKKQNVEKLDKQIHSSQKTLGKYPNGFEKSITHQQKSLKVRSISYNQFEKAILNEQVKTARLVNVKIKVTKRLSGERYDPNGEEVKQQQQRMNRFLNSSREQLAENRGYVRSLTSINFKRETSYNKTNIQTFWKK